MEVTDMEIDNIVSFNSGFVHNMYNVGVHSLKKDINKDSSTTVPVTSTTSTKSNPSKPPSDLDIVNIFMYPESGSSGHYPSTNTYNKCNNPLCDHIERDTVIDYVDYSISTLDDIISLGKTYHCKNNKEYNGVSLKILCDLVQPLTELQSLVGMTDVKTSIINQIVFFLQGFNNVTKCNVCLDCVYKLPCTRTGNKEMLHTVITGPPGVGKTELGKILGKIYKALGVISGGDIHIASRADLIAKYLGQTAAKTQEFIDKCKGGVMIIDEAYALGNKEGRDSFAKACIDTINQNLTERTDFLCIIMGYKDALEQCFFAQNEGLRRRFTFRYDITGYSSDELLEIFLQKVNKEGWCVDDNCLSDVREFFKDNLKFFPHYGGDVETFFLNCKIHHGRRVIFKDPSIRKMLTLLDIKKGFETFIGNREYKEEMQNTSQLMMYL